MQKIDRKALRRILENEDTLKLLNPVVETILQRRSIRKFTGDDFKMRLSCAKRSQYADLEIYRLKIKKGYTEFKGIYKESCSTK